MTISKKHQTYLENLAEKDLREVKGLKRSDPLKELADPDKTAMASVRVFVE